MMTTEREHIFRCMDGVLLSAFVLGGHPSNRISHPRRRTGTRSLLLFSINRPLIAVVHLNPSARKIPFLFVQYSYPSFLVLCSAARDARRTCRALEAQR
jgi:hypothetical protein